MSPTTAVQLLIGTKKGAFVAESDASRRRWRIRDPHLGGHQVMHMAFDPRSGILFAASGDPWFGSRVYRSWDFGHTWDEPAHGPAFPADVGRTLEKVWHVQPGRPQEPGVVYAGVEPAALFKSTDDGASWQFVEALERHPSRDRWAPSAGGLCLHSIILDSQDLDRLYVAISAAGVFRSDDGGRTWLAANTGLRTNFESPEPSYAEFGQCVHKVVQHPEHPDRLYQQSHLGVYRSDDHAEHWTEVTAGLPSDWGHPMAVHPHEPDTIYVYPCISQMEHWPVDGQMAVYRSRDGGATWERLTQGLPQRNAYLNAMREGMATDQLDPAGLYLGTNTGQLYYSADAGDSWRALPALFPPILSVGVIS
ncbi:MAG TPA: exo-alpha-sialidase [Dehalococcoidia bacterium]|nr:exo-alpha-sialidase [Dehalococcoidia bacterium]